MTDTLPPSGIDRLLAIMAALRDPQTGCPWDLEQTFATIAPYTLEEAHEVADAIDRQAWDDLKGELVHLHNGTHANRFITSGIPEKSPTIPVSIEAGRPARAIRIATWLIRP